jgi:ubiquitin-protein ligase
MVLKYVKREAMFNIQVILKRILSLLREPKVSFNTYWQCNSFYTPNKNAAKLFIENPKEYENEVQACVEQSLIKNPDLNRVKAEWKAKQEEFLRTFEEEEKERKDLAFILKHLLENPINGAIAVPRKSHCLLWDAVIFGLDESPFAGGIFTLQITFYEYKSPVVKFLSKMYHPNINENGEMQLENVKIEDRLNVHAVLKAVKSLLLKPNLRDEFLENHLAAGYYEFNLSEYEKQVLPCVLQSFIENPDLDKVKTEWKAKQEDFLRILKEEEDGTRPAGYWKHHCPVNTRKSNPF